MDYPKNGCPFKEGSRYYYFYNSGLQPQSVLMCQDDLQSEPRVFFDPNTLSQDGTISLSGYSFSESGKYFCYSLSQSGSDWVKVHFRAVDSSTDLEPPLEWVKFTPLEWSHDDKGIFYKRYPAPKTLTGDKSAGTETDANAEAKLYYHRLGTAQSQDLFIYMDQDPNAHPAVTVSEDGKYLLLFVTLSCDPNAKVSYLKLDEFLASPKDNPEFRPIVDNFDAAYEYITNDGPVLYFETTLQAPKKRIVKYDLDAPAKGFQEVIPEGKDVISFTTVVDGNKLIIARLADVKHVVTVHDLESGEQLYNLPLPVGSMVSSLTGKRKDKLAFYGAISYISPGIIYKYDFASNSQSVHRETVVKGLQSAALETKQVFYPSKDGTKIPMYLVYKKGLKLDGSHPCLLYGYGGFNISITPSFSPNFITFIQHMGGVVAVANIRGGSEYGTDWYYSGRLDKKQNVFDDFQAAAKYLHEHKYSSPAKTTINGGSNGGLLVGACLNQAPELFGCGVAEVGVLDMLHFHKFTIGHAWVSDYGNPDVKEDFEVLRKYSPYHNVKDQDYPAILILTGDHDDRVVPLHSLKFL
ncbi:hypothetical protein HDU91_001514, partial [Kappamyces sp. JEL0680]